MTAVILSWSCSAVCVRGSTTSTLAAFQFSGQFSLRTRVVAVTCGQNAPGAAPPPRAAQAAHRAGSGRGLLWSALRRVSRRCATGRDAPPVCLKQKTGRHAAMVSRQDRSA